MRSIVDLKLKKVEQRLLRHHGATLRYDKSLLDLIVSRCTEVDSGARDADAIISRAVLSEISGEVLARMAAGKAGARLRDNDSIEEVMHVMDHDHILFFTSDGIVRSRRAFQLPQGSRTSGGTPITQARQHLP